MNPITNTRTLIRHAIRQAKQQITNQTVYIELNITPDAVLYIDVLAREHPDGYNQLEIVAADVYKDTSRRECQLPNIAHAVAKELDRAIERNKIQNN